MLLSDLLATCHFAVLMLIFVQLQKILTLPIHSILLFWFHVVKACLLATYWSAAASYSGALNLIEWICRALQDPIIS